LAVGLGHVTSEFFEVARGDVDHFFLGQGLDNALEVGGYTLPIAVL
jgi:hypothetical protein